MDVREKLIVMNALTVAVNSHGVELKAIGKGETYDFENYDCCYTVYRGKPHKSVIFHKANKPSYIKIGNELFYMHGFRKVIS